MMANVLRGQGDSSNQAGDLINKAADLRAEIPWAPDVDKSKLTEKDFDDLVMYWSR